ncbi:MAG: (2Fe-2S)-binding protein [Acidobacteria bacterium]|nr:(2Fe-2S)-binding protein [Acidobacteriota bacterium]
MSSKKEPQSLDKRKAGFSRRGFLGGVGLGAAGTGLLERPAEASPAAVAVSGPGPVPITLTINGKPVNLKVEPRVTLLDAMRNHMEPPLTGAKRVCDRGSCGACTVIMNGKSVYACTVLAIDAQGKRIETIESLPVNNPISTAFVDHDAQQCGYCTPGFVMATKAFLAENPNPTVEQVNHGLGGNLCRCGTYMGIRQAVVQASKAMKGAKQNG